MMKKIFLTALLTAFLTLNVSAQNYPPKEAPQLEFALQLKVTLGETFGINNTNTDAAPSFPSRAEPLKVPTSKAPLSTAAPTISWPMPTGARSWRPSIASRPTTASTSMYVIVASSPTARTPRAVRRSTSALPLSSRLLPIVSTAG